MTLSISNLETIDTSQRWQQSGVRVDIGSSVAIFEEECDAEDAVIAMSAVDDVMDIIEAARKWRRADATEKDVAQAALIALIDKVRE